MCISIAEIESIYVTLFKPGKFGIWQSKKIDGKYKDPEYIIPKAAHPFIAPDESYLIFDRYGANRVSKLYVSFQSDDMV